MAPKGGTFASHVTGIMCNALAQKSHDATEKGKVQIRNAVYYMGRANCLTRSQQEQNVKEFSRESKYVLFPSSTIE